MLDTDLYSTQNPGGPEEEAKEGPGRHRVSWKSLRETRGRPGSSFASSSGPPGFCVEKRSVSSISFSVFKKDCCLTSSSLSWDSPRISQVSTSSFAPPANLERNSGNCEKCFGLFYKLLLSFWLWNFPPLLFQKRILFRRFSSFFQMLLTLDLRFQLDQLLLLLLFAWGHGNFGAGAKSQLRWSALSLRFTHSRLLDFSAFAQRARWHLSALNRTGVFSSHKNAPMAECGANTEYRWAQARKSGKRHLH